MALRAGMLRRRRPLRHASGPHSAAGRAPWQRRDDDETLLLTGVATHFVVEGTAREAVDRGYNVVIVQDCCSAMNAEGHEMSLNNALPFLTVISSSDEVMATLR